MKTHAVYLSIIALLAISLGWAWSVFDERKATWEARLAGLEKDLAASRESSERWRVAATTLEEHARARSALAEACLRREAAALDDAAQREVIVQMGPAVPVNKDAKDKGVSDATRRAAADYLNRGL